MRKREKKGKHWENEEEEGDIAWFANCSRSGWADINAQPAAHSEHMEHTHPLHPNHIVLKG